MHKQLWELTSERSNKRLYGVVAIEVRILFTTNFLLVLLKVATVHQPQKISAPIFLLPDDTEWVKQKLGILSSRRYYMLLKLYSPRNLEV